MNSEHVLVEEREKEEKEGVGSLEDTEGGGRVSFWPAEVQTPAVVQAGPETGVWRLRREAREFGETSIFLNYL